MAYFVSAVEDILTIVTDEVVVTPTKKFAIAWTRSREVLDNKEVGVLLDPVEDVPVDRSTRGVHACMDHAHLTYLPSRAGMNCG